MDASTMLFTANVLLAITGLGGIVMAAIRFAGADHPPSWLAMVHGLVAGSALTLLLYVGFAVGLATMVWVGIGLLLLAALGGVVLNLGYHLKGVPLPKGFVVGHGVLAIIGFGLIFLGTMR